MKRENQFKNKYLHLFTFTSSAAVLLCLILCSANISKPQGFVVLIIHLFPYLFVAVDCRRSFLSCLDFLITSSILVIILLAERWEHSRRVNINKTQGLNFLHIR
nr:hypothetical protein [Tanacetum cinerariifolium]